MSMKNTIKKVANVALQIATGIAIVVIIMFATAIRPGNEHEIAPALMEEYNVDSFEELMQYGH